MPILAMSIAMKPSPAFKRGDLVQKRSGYRYPGVVLVAYYTLNNQIRYVVEADPQSGFAGMQHIFNEEQLELRQL